VYEPISQRVETHYHDKGLTCTF